MEAPSKQHLIDPEICIRCHACVDACPKDAITYNDDNVVVDPGICDFGMSCIGPCPTGAIDNWRIVAEPHSVEDQLSWMELPEQVEFLTEPTTKTPDTDAMDAHIAALLATAHQGAGGAAKAPPSAGKPAVNLFTNASPIIARVQGNFRLTGADADSDIRHIILDLGAAEFPVLEGQTVGVVTPGTDKDGRAHGPRLYSVSSPRSGERPNTNNLSLTVKREKQGYCSNYICDLERDDTVSLTGPFGTTFLLPQDPNVNLIMVCTGTGSAPFRGFTMHRQRVMPDVNGKLHLFFGARGPDALPYFGPLAKVPEAFLQKRFAFSRAIDRPKTYVQDLLRQEASAVGAMLKDPQTYIYLCGLKAMEAGVEAAFQEIANKAGYEWNGLRDMMRNEGRYHVETY